MRPMRRFLVVLMLSLALGVAPLAAQNRSLGPQTGPAPSFDLTGLFDTAWHALSSLLDKVLPTGGDGSSSTTQTTTPPPGISTTDGAPTDNGAGIDPNG
jgi:hypothetical protein